MALLATTLQAVESVQIATEKVVVDSESALVKILETTQENVQGVSVPTQKMHVYGQASPYPVDWSGFSKKTTKYLTAEMDEFGLPRYRLLLHEDVVSRDRIITLASTGFEVARIPAPKDYQPEIFYDNLLLRGAVYSEMMRWIFDPAHSATEVVLYPETLYPAYVEYEAEQTAQENLLASMAMSMSAPMAMMMGAGTELTIEQNLSSYEDGWLDIHNADIGQEYEVYFTYNLQYVPFSTNTSSYYTAWPAKVGLIGESDGVAYWSAPMINENGMHRDAGFFKAYSSDDSDGDGLSDIFELMMTKTDPNDPFDIDGVNLDGDVDQDGDGFSNREEYLGLGADIYTHPRKINTDGDNKNDDVDPWPMDAAGAEDTDRDRMPDDLYQNRTSTSYPMLIADADDDNDRFSDAEEATMGSDSKDVASPGSTAYLDTDGDGLFDWQDPYPTNPDGDGDDIGDGYEINVLGNSATVFNSYTQTEKDAYTAVSGDTDSDGKPQWAENIDSTNPNDGLDFAVNIF